MHELDLCVGGIILLATIVIATVTVRNVMRARRQDRLTESFYEHQKRDAV